MKYFSITLLSLLALGTQASAASSVTFASQLGGNYLSDASGVPLPNGSLVLIGTFANASAIDSVPVGQIEQNAGWSLFGNTVTSEIIGNAGKLNGTVLNSTPEADAFAGQRIFLWVFNAPTISSATEYGIFTALQADFEWIFEADLIDGNSYLELDDSSLTALLGTIDGNALTLTAIAVPEPATYAAMLGAAGIAFAVLRRRKAAQRRNV